MKGLRLIAPALIGLIVAVRLDIAAAGTASTPQEAEWERTVAAAKKEGQVTIYTSSNQNSLFLESGAFQKRFPEIKAVVSLGDPVSRILTERRGEKYLADVAFTGPPTVWGLYLAKVLDPIRDAIILPEVADESKWFEGKHHYIDTERKYVFVSTGNPDSGSIFYNTKLINPKDFRSFWDFLRPELKGKIAARDVRTPGSGNGDLRFYYLTPDLGPKFISRLFGEMDITLFRDARQAVDWLATGKFPICFFCSNTAIERAGRQGLPVAKIGTMKEGGILTASASGLTLLNNAPHPNAARVFINWLLSREGQIAIQSVDGTTNSRRIDIPKDMVAPPHRFKEGVKYLPVDTAELMNMEPMFKIVSAALAEAEKRRAR